MTPDQITFLVVASGEAVVAERQRIKVDYELPMRDEYTRFVLALLDKAAKEGDK